MKGKIRTIKKQDRVRWQSAPIVPFLDSFRLLHPIFLTIHLAVMLVKDQRCGNKNERMGLTGNDDEKYG